MTNALKCLLAAVFALSLGYQPSRAEERKRPDAWITTKVKSALASHKNVSAIRTNVDTKDGVVTLRGSVDTQAEKDLAGRYAEAVQGVKSVDNQLVIKGDAERDDSGTFDRDRDADNRVEGAGDRAVNKAENAGDDAANKVEGAGDRAMAKIGDAALLSRVKSALGANRATSAFRTNVDVKGGKVTLRGTAKSDAEKDLAEKIASGVNGVKSVDNEIDVVENP